jgi:hypothetical protein
MGARCHGVAATTRRSSRRRLRCSWLRPCRSCRLPTGDLPPCSQPLVCVRGTIRERRRIPALTRRSGFVVRTHACIRSRHQKELPLLPALPMTVAQSKGVIPSEGAQDGMRLCPESAYSHPGLGGFLASRAWRLGPRGLAPHDAREHPAELLRIVRQGAKRRWVAELAPARSCVRLHVASTRTKKAVTDETVTAWWRFVRPRWGC